MTAFLPNVTINNQPSSRWVRSVLAGVSGYLAARRERAKLKAEIRHLQELPPHLVRDAGIDQGPLFSAVARIVEVHEVFMFGSSQPQKDCSERPQVW